MSELKITARLGEQVCFRTQPDELYLEIRTCGEVVNAVIRNKSDLRKLRDALNGIRIPDEPPARRYRDCDGDIWTMTGSDQYSPNYDKSELHTLGYIDSTYGPLKLVADEDY